MFSMGTLDLFNTLWRSRMQNEIVFDREEDSYKLSLPGIGKENIEVVDEKNYIVVHWKKMNGDKEHKDKIILRTPIHSEVSADYTDGVLTIQLKEEKGKVIKIT